MLKKITLIKASQVPLLGPIRPSGYSAEVDESTFEYLLKRGVILDEDAPAKVGDDSVPDSPQEDPIGGQGDSEGAPAEVASAPGKPKPTDSIEKQREYATKHGIDPKGLSRAQLVKAIRDL